MEIEFGKNLRALRRARELTQEALAERLGVSFQTVSKWERGETLPDIAALPEVAAFFGVTIDALLGADRAKREKKIGEYLALYEGMTAENAPEVLRRFRAAAREFPNEFPILIRYMELLQRERNSPDSRRDAEETAEIYARIQKRCTDDSIRIRAKRLMLQSLNRQYCTLGYDEAYRRQAEAIIAELPALEDARELAEGEWATAENWYEVKGKEIEELTYLLQNAVIGYCYYAGDFTAQYRIRVIEHMNGVIQMIDTDERPTKNRLHLIYNYGHLGHLYAELGDKENALANFRRAADAAVRFDRLPEAKRTAMYYEQEEQIRKMGARERLYRLMTEHYPLSKEFRETKEFREIAEGLDGKF